MNVDSFFTKGYSHEICEDYSLGINEEFPLFLVSDGCSQNKYTDIGSRLLVLSAKQVFYSIGTEIKSLSTFKIGNLIIEKAAISAKNLNIPISALNATLLIGWVDEKQTNILMFGDGGLFYKKKDKNIEYKIIEYSENTPFYISYLLGGMETYKNKKQDKIEITESESKKSENLFVSEYSFDNNEIEWIFLVSDGVDSFVNKNNSNAVVEKSDIYNEICNFKNYNGEFLKRRIKRGFKNLEKNKIEHHDDFSIAGINFFD